MTLQNHIAESSGNAHAVVRKEGPPYYYAATEAVMGSLKILDCPHHTRRSGRVRARHIEKQTYLMVSEEDDEPNIPQMMAAAKLESVAGIRKSDPVPRLVHPIVVIGVEAPGFDVLNCDSHYNLRPLFLYW
jgi:hypothetical protein